MRGVIAGLLLVVGLVLVPFADLGIWTRRQLLPTDAFTDVATEVVQQDAVQAALASRVADEIVAREPRVRLGRVVLEPAVRQALGTPQFEQIFRLAVTSTHQQLVRGDDQLTLNLDGLLPIVRGFVANVDQGLASRIPDSLGLPAFTVVRKSEIPQLWFGVDVTRRASWVFPVLMVLALAAAIAVAPKHALMLVIAGFGVAFFCLMVVLALRVGRDMLSDVVGPEVDVNAFDAGYDVVTDSLVNQTFVLGGIGIVAAAVGVVLMVRRGANTRPAVWA
ncbi:MAG TPA: hypothetical protein VIH82_05505 [Acidimicrobiia bacterium]|jgi:hypothetical protein